MSDSVIIIKHLTAQNVSPIRIWQDLQRVHGPLTLSQTAVRNWSRHFSIDPGASCLDRPHVGGPKFARTARNQDKLRQLIRQDNRRSLRELASILKVSVGTVHHILHEDLQMRKLSVRFVPKILSEEQRACHLEVCQQNLQRLKDEPHLLSFVVSGDES